MRSRKVQWGWAAALVITALSALPRSAAAFPQFARKYHLPCTRCHSMVPRLTPFGYEFLRAGFRLPGNDVKPVTLLNSIAPMILQFNIRSRVAPNAFMVGNDTALATSIGKQWAAHIRYTIGTADGASSGFDDFWFQYNTAAKGTYWSIKAGQIPVLDGFQLMGDRTLTLTDAQFYGPNGPLAGTNAALNDFAVSSLETGVEVGYQTGSLSTRVSWLYGINQDGASQNIAYDSNRFNDYAIQSDYLIGNQGSGIGAFYYNGRTPLPAVGIRDNFQRAGLFGTYSTYLKMGSHGIPSLQGELNFGVLYGHDEYAVAKSAESIGTLMEGDLYFNHKSALAVRYDTERVANIVGTPVTNSYTFSYSIRPSQSVLLELEYRKQNNPGTDSFTTGIEFLY